MESIEALREYAGRFDNSNDAWSGIARDLSSIADRIDAEHEQEVEAACAEAYGNGVQSVALPDMAAYAKLPVDAEGEPIHVGDVMENIVCPPVHREVTGVGVECFYGWDDGNGRYSQFGASCYRHHHAPTVEDVLRKFAEGLGVPVADSYIAASAAKLKLAGDE